MSDHMINEPEEERGRQRKKAPPSEGTLTKAALRYLQRFPTTQARLERFLWRTLTRSSAPPTSEETAPLWVESVVTHMKEWGYINDAIFARDKALSLHRRGQPLSMIREGLKGYGVPAHWIKEALAGLHSAYTHPDIRACLLYLRKRRLGPYRSHKTQETYQKDLATLGRRGFSYGVAVHCLKTPLSSLEDIQQEKEEKPSS